MMPRLLLATAALTSFVGAKPPARPWTLALHPRLALWTLHGVEVSARVAPLRGLVACPSIRIEWGDGSASEHAADCDEGTEAEPMTSIHRYTQPGQFVVAVTVEEAGKTMRLERTVEIVG